MLCSKNYFPSPTNPSTQKRIQNEIWQNLILEKCGNFFFKINHAFFALNVEQISFVNKASSKLSLTVSLVGEFKH